MKRCMKWVAPVLALALVAPLTAQAHKFWLLPSQTVLSGGQDNWITVDAAVSNDLFYFNHHALGLDDLRITAPDGSEIPAENEHTAKWRSTFDVHLKEEGSYKLAVAGDSLFARYELDGEHKRWRGSPETLDRIPEAAKNVEVTQSTRRLETFVTVGAPTREVLQPTGAGLELAPVTHPNDLYATEKATFRLLLDGKPVSGVEVTVIPGGTRYRNAPEAIKVDTAEDGSFDITWPRAGMYWMSAAYKDQKVTLKPATERRLSYVATFEVLPL